MAAIKQPVPRKKLRVNEPQPQKITRLRVQAKAELTKPTRLRVQAQTRIKKRRVPN